MKKVILALLLVLVANFAQAQTPTPTGQGDRLGFTQQTTATELPLLSWVPIIDEVEQTAPLLNVSCTVSQTDSTQFNCVADYPALTPGVHRIRLKTVRTEGTLVLSSQPSVPFDFTFVVNPNTATNLHNERKR